MPKDKFSLREYYSLKSLPYLSVTFIHSLLTKTLSEPVPGALNPSPFSCCSLPFYEYHEYTSHTLSLATLRFVATPCYKSQAL